MHHQQCAVNNPIADGGHIAQAVNGFVQRGVGVDVAAEVHTDGLEILDDALAGEVLRAVESHVFKEMRQTVLVILLQHGSDRLRNVELAALFGVLVVADVVGQSVVQMTDAHAVLHGKRLCLLRENGQYRAQQQSDA